MKSAFHCSGWPLLTCRSNLRVRSLVILAIFVLGFLSWPGSLQAQKNPEEAPTTLPPAEGERQARSLIADLLSQKPSENSRDTGSVQIRASGGKPRELAANFEVIVTPTNYGTIYQVTGASGREEPLTIYHSGTQPSDYFMGSNKLTQSQIMTPFAGSDFWVADLGLEFLHWPQQRIVRKEMRQHTFCAVLESINPNPVPGGYLRVVSWIGAHPGETILVHADAFDEHGARLKRFDPKNLKKINGAYQLESMEMHNDRTGSRTIIEFNLKKDER